jgi:tetratricopeptide (TPR) repeat protein
VKKIIVFILLLSAFAFSHDELAEQVEAVTKEIRRSPRDARLYFQRAELYRADGHWKDAEVDYRKAKKLAPDMIPADLGLGLVYLATNRLNESRQSLEGFVSEQPDHAEARVALGQVWNRLGNRMAAVEQYSRALTLRPDPEIYIERSKLLSEENRLEQAITGLNEGIQQLGPIVTLELFAIDLEMQLHRYDHALSRVQQIANQSERKETWYAKRAEILALAKRIPEAREAYQMALAEIQKLPQTKRSTKYTLELEARIQKSIEQLEQNAVE